MMLQPAPGLTPPPEPSIVIEGTKLNNVECFTYLGSTLTSKGSMDREVSNRLAKAGAFLADCGHECGGNVASSCLPNWQCTGL